MAICSGCGNDYSDEDAYCIICGAPVQSGAMVLPITVSSGADTTTPPASDSFIANTLTFISESAWIAVSFILRPLLAGFAGLSLGIAVSFIFRSYLVSHVTHFNQIIFFLFSAIYFCVGAAYLWGYIGFLSALAKALDFILIKKKALEWAAAKLAHNFLLYIQKASPVKFGLKSGDADFGRTAVEYHTVKKALRYFENSDISGEISVIKTSRKTGFFTRLALRLIMKNELAAVILHKIRHAYRDKKTLSFSELKSLIVNLAGSAGGKFISDFYSDKIILFSILIPI
ncbi:MAG: hypothetical protein WCX65_16850, partial [bacterium]